MLWEASRERLDRESRGRLTELYTGVHDGYVAANVSLGKAKASGDVTPRYARAEASRAAPTVEAQRATLARLGQWFPGSVQGRIDS